MITVSVRDLTASKNQLRKQGLIPGIVYSKQKNVPITISQREYDKARATHEPVMTTSMGDMVVMKEVQREPVSGKILHVSFQHIVKGQKFTATIPIHLVHPEVNFGNSGLVLKTLHAKVEVEGTAETMVDHVTVDVSKMAVHDLIRIKDLPVINGIEYLDDPETQVAVLDYAQAEETAPDTTEAPVEVIKEAKEAPKA